MARQFCFQCGKKLGRFLQLGLNAIDLKALESPKGMTNNDYICDECFSKLPKNKELEKERTAYHAQFVANKAVEKEEREKQKELEKEEYKKQKELEEKEDSELKKEIDEIKSHFQKGSTVYKDEYCAIVKKIDDLTFVKAFRNLTREGYRMMAQDEGGQFHLGIASVGSGSYYFFQKIEYITLKNDVK
jgi:hypothetical protein